MNLLYLVPSLNNPGGMERILAEKINYLITECNYNVFVATTEEKGKNPYFKLNEKVNLIQLDLNFNDFFNYNLVSKFYNTKKKLRLYENMLHSIIKENNIDICVSLGGKELEFLHSMKVDCAKICELHFSKSIRSQFLISRSKSFLNRILGNIRTKQLINQTKKLDKLVVLTKDDEADWKQTNDNVIQIYNFSTIKPQNLTDLSQKTAIAVGRLDAQKGFDLLIDAWKIVAQSNTDWKLNIFGVGEWDAMLKNKISEAGLSDFVFLKGNSSEIDKEMSNSSLFILSSRYEGFPMVLLESLSCGLPLVAFNCKTGPSEVIENDDCGILVPHENVGELANSISKLISDPQLLKKKSLHAKLKSDNFSKESVMNSWITLFKTLKK